MVAYSFTLPIDEILSLSNMKKWDLFIKIFKYSTITLVNIFFIYCAIKASFFDLESDSNSMFSVIMFVLMLLYDIYVLFIMYMAETNSLNISNRYINFTSAILCAFPLFLIIYGFIL